MSEGKQQPEIPQDVSGGISFMLNFAVLSPRPDDEEAGSGQCANSSITDIQGAIRHCEKAATNSWFQQFSNLAFISR